MTARPVFVPGQRRGKRMPWRRIVLAAMLLSGFCAVPAAAQEAIGAVSRIQGNASGNRGGATRALAPNAAVFRNEVVSTGEATRLEVTFIDSTRVTLGENTRLRLDRYVFNPGAGRGVIRFRVAGAVRFLSGQVSRLARSEVSVITPFATVGVRGTEFWAGPIDNQVLGVLLVEGAVSVSNAAGRQILNQPGQGTNIARRGAAPGPVTFWPPDKANRALAATAFQ